MNSTSNRWARSSCTTYLFALLDEPGYATADREPVCTVARTSVGLDIATAEFGPRLECRSARGRGYMKSDLISLTAARTCAVRRIVFVTVVRLIAGEMPSGARSRSPTPSDPRLRIRPRRQGGERDARFRLFARGIRCPKHEEIPLRRWRAPSTGCVSWRAISGQRVSAFSNRTGSPSPKKAVCW